MSVLHPSNAGAPVAICACFIYVFDKPSKPMFTLGLEQSERRERGRSPRLPDLLRTAVETDDKAERRDGSRTLQAAGGGPLCMVGDLKT